MLFSFLKFGNFYLSIYFVCVCMWTGELLATVPMWRSGQSARVIFFHFAGLRNWIQDFRTMLNALIY